MEEVEARWKSNQDVNNIQGLIDLVTDEYGNYYTPYKTTNQGSKLTEVVLCHALYDNAFSMVFLQDEWKEVYKFSHLGEPLVDTLNAHIASLNESGRVIFSVKKLIENGTQVSFYKITSYKTQNKGK
ncbi:hypothetical protein [Mesobacillus foraminis]|uniref:Uncharacterized protein n=1 Tax=Mesobacillus foraminis TaxID=279826 RepID=A0A4V2RDN2_9BACI|nr:hypothetical protein [Mesobacillus foraminis]TCN25470.1 hypothetical protein EV146_105127 [Mesobacillus foraminis]